MKRIDTATADPNLHGTGKAGFRDGVAASGMAPTRHNASFNNHLQEEIARTVEGFGDELDPDKYTQLLSAIHTAVRVLPVLSSLALRASDTSHTYDVLEDVCFVPFGGALGLGFFLGVGWSSADLLTASETIWTSYDGINWAKASGTSLGRLRGVAANSDVIVVVGGTQSGEDMRIAKATIAGSTFSTIDLSAFGAIAVSGAALHDVCWVPGHDRFVACGRRVVAGLALMYGSADASSWALATSDAGFMGEFYESLAVGTRALIFGTVGEIQSSDDGGQTWVRRHSDPDLGSITSAVYANGVIICNTSQQRTMLRSTDNGNTWTEIQSPTYLENAGIVDAVIEHVGRFDKMLFAVCKDSSTGRRYIIGSLDGAQTWKYLVRMPAIDINGAATAKLVGSANDNFRLVVIGVTDSLNAAYAFGSSGAAVGYSG